MRFHIFPETLWENEKFKKYKKSVWKKSILASVLIICLSTPSAGLTKPSEYPSELIASGKIVGISVKSDGVVIVSLGEVETDHGRTTPAADAGLLSGDIIKNIGSYKVTSIEDIRSSIKAAEGKEVTVRLERSGKELQLAVTPALNLSGVYELGVWLRDGLAGMGTVTFADPKSGIIGVLGHPINDSDAKVMLPIKSGILTDASVGSIIKGKSGSPGQLQGNLDLEKKFAAIYSNTESGIFGVAENDELMKGKAVPVGQKKDIKVGDAYIISNISGQFENYDIEISRIYSGGDERNMLITVIDEKLISQTGGIVQGMSGSPIIQNGKLIGAVTHVLVNEPVKGYGISIENMLEKAFLDEEQMAA